MIQDKDSQEIENLSKTIIQSLESSPTDGIEFYKSILLGNDKTISFEDYLENLQETLKKCTCQASWQSNTLIIRCETCQKSRNSCICVKCFLKGNHDGHKVMVSHGSSGCCDCGDQMSWTESGFCSEHSGSELNPDLTQLDPATRINPISISKSAFHYCHKYASTNHDYFNNIIDFLSELVSLGDATRRCVCLAICDSFDIIDLYTNCNNFEISQCQNLFSFISSISSDEVFRTHFSTTILNNFPKLMEKSRKLASEIFDSEDPSIFSMKNLFNLTFYASTPSVVVKLIRESKIDWFNFLNETFLLNFLYDSSQFNQTFFENTSRFESMNRTLSVFKSVLKVFGGKNPKIIEIVEILVQILSNNEFGFPFVRVFGDKIEDENYGAVFDAHFNMYTILSKIIRNEIYTTKPLTVLKKFFSSDVFKSIDKNINDYQIYFHSVLSKNVQISQLFPTHTFSFHCLNLKEKKKLIDYISEVTDNVELFIKRWAVIPLRWIAASTFSHYNFFVRNSDDQLISLISFKFLKNIKYCFTMSFTLIQSLLKTTKQVDSFLFMIISTFDLSVIESRSNYDDNEKRAILFDIFHFITCLIFDTLCCEKKFFEMHRLLVMSELMAKNMTIEEIKSLWYKDITFDERFLDELNSFTSKETTKNGTILHLTDSTDWHPILPFIVTRKIIPLIQKFISKNPDSLVNFPQIPKGSEYLLFSPALWALEYCILENQASKDYHIIHQLVFNVLIETSKNCESYYKDKKEEKFDDSILQADDFESLIDQLKKMSFTQFIQKKINFNFENDEGKSMIDLIKRLGNIGMTVLKRMNVSDEYLSDENVQLKDQIKKKNKERADQMKKQMMDNFIQKQKTFQSTISQVEETTEKDQKIECGICHIENDSDCFVYPAYVYKSPLSSYINYLFRNAKLDSNSSHITNDNSDIFPDSFDLYNSVQICLHPIHSHCIQRENYLCPADRCIRNNFLPIINGICDFNQISNQAILDGISNFIKTAYYNDLKFAVFSLASEIEVLEMRYRSNPNCLYNKTIHATLRNIYLCIWHSLHENAEKVLINEETKRRRDIIVNKIKNKTWNQYKNECNIRNLPNVDPKLTAGKNADKICQFLLLDPIEINENEEIEKIHLSPLMKYILFCIKLDEENDSHFPNMQKFIDGKLFPLKIEKNDLKIHHNESDMIFKDFNVINDLSSDYQKLQFLRCAAIFDHFSRNKNIANKNNDLIDWDDILCSSFLHDNVYNIENKIDDDLFLPMFSLFNVPKNFFDFILPPFSLRVDLNDDKLAICLLTGKVVSFDHFSNNQQIDEFILQKFKDSFSVVLLLNGENSSEIMIYSGYVNQRVSLNSFYTNKFNDIDIGFKNGFLLSLNDSKIEDIIDNLLSGFWISKINI